jgi:hypothetical protein
MRMQKFSIASEDIDTSVANSSQDFEFPLANESTSLDSEVKTLTDIVEKFSEVKGKDAEKDLKPIVEELKVSISDLVKAAASTYRYVLNYRVTDRDSGEMRDSLMDHDVSRGSQGRANRIGIMPWLSVYTSQGAKVPLAEVHVRKQIFFDQIEKEYQENRKELGIAAPETKVASIDSNPFED